MRTALCRGEGYHLPRLSLLTARAHATAILGGFFVVNLFLAVIFDEFMRTTEIEEAVADDAARVAAAGSAVSEPKAGTVASKETAAARAARANEKAAAEAAADTSLLPRGAERSDGGDGGESAPGCCTRLCDCAPGESGWRHGLAAIVTSDWFGNCSTALVVINLLVMCMPYAGQSTGYANLVETLGTVITVIFMVEMVLKLIGLGCKGYWSDGWNQLDGCADEPTPNISQHLLQTARARATEQSCFSRQST